MNIVYNHQIRSVVFLKIVMSYATVLRSCPLNFLCDHPGLTHFEVEFYSNASIILQIAFT